MKDNCYLLNCRRNICDAIKRTPVAQGDIRRDLQQALIELDAFRHGALQRCENCTDYDHKAELAKCPI